MNRNLLWPAIVALMWLPACATGSPEAPEAGATAALDAFYAAIKRGDATAAMTHVGPDAVFLESGGLETRAEYEKNHLPLDIGFERQVTGRRGPVKVTVHGDTAWIIITTAYDGTFEGNPVKFTSAQLAVLARTEGRWLIRSIHWSSR